jgi:hypothetical protein
VVIISRRRQRARADEFMGKPEDIVALPETVRRLLGLSSATFVA